MVSNKYSDFSTAALDRLPEPLLHKEALHDKSYISLCKCDQQYLQKGSVFLHYKVFLN